MNSLSDRFFVKDGSNKDLPSLTTLLERSIELNDLNNFQRVIIKIREQYHLMFVKNNDQTVKNADDFSNMIYNLGSFCLRNGYWETLELLIPHLRKTLEHIASTNSDYDGIFLAAEASLKRTANQQELIYVVENLAAFDFLLFVQSDLKKTIPLFSMYPESRGLVELTHEKNFFNLNGDKFEEISELINTSYSDFQDKTAETTSKIEQLRINHQKKRNSFGASAW